MLGNFEQTTGWIVWDAYVGTRHIQSGLLWRFPHMLIRKCDFQNLIFNVLGVVKQVG